jgi:hypothetical protein
MKTIYGFNLSKQFVYLSHFYPSLIFTVREQLASVSCTVRGSTQVVSKLACEYWTRGLYYKAVMARIYLKSLSLKSFLS